MKKFNNKGAVELSLNLIIMLIIGLTILGLVIGFVTGLIGDAKSSFDERFSSTEESYKQEALDAPGYFAVRPTDINLKRGENKRIFVKVENLGTGPFDFELGDGASAAIQYNVEVIGEGECTLELSSPTRKIAEKEQEAVQVMLTANSDCQPDDEMFLTLTLTDADKSETVNVKITS